MALNLVVAAIVLWNTAYLNHALQRLQQESIAAPEDIVPHLSPLGWEHITITGTYHWKGAARDWGTVQPLRRDAVDFLKAKIA